MTFKQVSERVNRVDVLKQITFSRSDRRSLEPVELDGCRPLPALPADADGPRVDDGNDAGDGRRGLHPVRADRVDRVHRLQAVRRDRLHRRRRQLHRDGAAAHRDHVAARAHGHGPRLHDGRRLLLLLAGKFSYVERFFVAQKCDQKSCMIPRYPTYIAGGYTQPR